MWGRLHSPFWVLGRRGRNKKEEEAERIMVSTISFNQANLQHKIAASGDFNRIVGIKGIDMALVQEPWCREDCIRGLNVPGYTLYSTGGKERPRACILARNMNAWGLPGFSCRDLVAILIKYIADGAERRLVVCYAYLLYDYEDLPTPPIKGVTGTCAIL